MCPDIETLERLVAGGLPAEVRAPTEEHISGCHRCRVRRGEIEANLRLAGRVADNPPTPQDMPTERVLAIAPVTRADVPTPGSTLPSDSFPGYQLLREISRGGQGVVYQAIQQSTKRKVAIKVLRDGHFADAGERGRFEREVQVLGQLKHANIVNIYDSGRVGGNAFYVMDYVSGKPLDEYVAESKLAVRATLALFAEVCDAVHAAHLKGIIHRDLKPSNIRVDADGAPRVLDFGLAKLAGAPEQARTPVMTLTGQFLGSLPWSSPEQAEGQPSKIDIRTDVYALGVVLYQLLTGQFPYDVAGNMRDALDRIQHAPPLRPSTFNRSIGDEVSTIVLKCLSKERERRYQSAGELARDIRHYLAGEPIEAKRDSSLYVLRKTLRRHWRTTAALGTILLLIVGSSVVALVLLQRAAAENRRAVATMQFLDRVLTMHGQRPGSADASAPERGNRTVGAPPRDRPPPPGGRLGRVGPPADADSPGDPSPAGGSAKWAEAPAGRPGRAPPPDHGQGDPARRLIPPSRPGAGLGRRPLGRTFRDVLDGAVLALERGELSRTPDAEGRVRLILGRAYASLGAFDTAEQQLAAAVSIGRAIGGEYDRLVADGLHELGDLYWQQEKLDRAETCLRDALPRRQAIHGADSPQVGRTLALLGALDWRNGRLEEAAQLLARAVAIFERHPDDRMGRGNALTVQGLIHESRGELDEAQRLFGVATEIVQSDELSPPLATSEINAARIATRRGDFERAQALIESATERLMGIVPPDHPEFLTIRLQRGELHLAEGDAARAEDVLRRVVEDAEFTLGPRSPDLALYQRSYAKALMELGRLDDAEHELQESLAIFREAWPQRTEVLANAKSVLGDCIRRQGRFAEAEPLLLSAYADLVNFKGEYYFDRIPDACRRVLALYEAWETAEPGQGHNQELAQWRAKLQELQGATPPGKKGG